MQHQLVPQQKQQEVDKAKRLAQDGYPIEQIAAMMHIIHIEPYKITWTLTIVLQMVIVMHESPATRLLMKKCHKAPKPEAYISPNP